MCPLQQARQLQMACAFCVGCQTHLCSRPQLHLLFCPLCHAISCSDAAAVISTPSRVPRRAKVESNSGILASFATPASVFRPASSSVLQVGQHSGIHSGQRVELRTGARPMLRPSPLPFLPTTTWLLPKLQNDEN